MNSPMKSGRINAANNAADSDSDMYATRLGRRRVAGTVWLAFFRISTLVGLVALSALLINIINSVVGFVAIQNKIEPSSLAIDGVDLDDLDTPSLISILQNHISAGLFKRFENDLSFAERSREDVLSLVYERVVEPSIVAQWNLYESIARGDGIRAEVARDFPLAKLEFRSWLTWRFITSPQSSDAAISGVRGAIYGSLWTILIAVTFAFPVGVGAAVYLEEYGNRKTVVGRIIATNINNLAGVPSIIYGILGLAIFVRALEHFTSGAFLGTVDPTTASGRTIISAGLTLGLLILPLIIINAQEAIRAVPNSIRLASFGLGATQWQTVWSHVLPGAMPGILTGTILSISRAIGETAPLIVVGASTYITFDPQTVFSKFTTLPIQIYQWTSRPQDIYRNIAAAAILVLLILLFILNATAVILRNRYSRRQ